MEGIDRCHAALVQMSFHGRAGGSTIVIEKCLEDGPVMFDGLGVPAVCELVVRRWHRPDKVTKQLFTPYMSFCNVDDPSISSVIAATDLT